MMCSARVGVGERAYSAGEGTGRREQGSMGEGIHGVRECREGEWGKVHIGSRGSGAQQEKHRERVQARGSGAGEAQGKVCVEQAECGEGVCGGPGKLLQLQPQHPRGLEAKARATATA